MACYYGATMLQKNQINKLQKIQNKCLKYILPKDNSFTACKKLNILNIKDMLKLVNLKFGYKLANKLLPSRIITICQEDSKKQTLLPKHQYNTRQKNPKSPQRSK